jgi:hypothetical protein
MAIEIAVNKLDIDRATIEIAKMLKDCDVVKVTIKPVRSKRTLSQNNAIHKWCEMMAECLNDGGFTYAHFIELINNKGVEVPWDMEKVKLSWQIMQEAMIGHNHTSNLETHEVSKIYEVVNRRFAELAGVSLPFPDRFNQGN